MKSLRIATFMLVALAGSPVCAQVANDTVLLSSDGSSSLSDIYLDGMPEVTDFVTKGFVGKTAEELAKSSETAAVELAELNKVLNKLSNNRKMSPALSAEGRKMIAQNKAAASKLNANSSWYKKVGNLLKIIDFVSTASKASAYAVEGDGSGAAAVVIQDVVKKTAEAAGALGLSWFPGGQVAGAFLGEQAYSEYLAPSLSKHEERVRDAEWREKYLNKPWLPSASVILTDGTVHKLEPDTFVDKQTQQIVRRSAAQQAVFEGQAKRKWENGRKLLNFEKLRDEGKIDQETFERIVEDYRNRDPYEPWEPDLFEAGVETYDVPTMPIENIVPQRMVANIGYVDDFFGTITVSLSFWNVGSLVDGKGVATITIANPTKGGFETDIMAGTFSGGPDGVFSFVTEEDGTIKGTMRNGHRVEFPGEPALAVQNPDAFADWR